MSNDNKELRPEQIRVNSNKIMYYKERSKWLKNSELGKLFGLK